MSATRQRSLCLHRGPRRTAWPRNSSPNCRRARRLPFAAIVDIVSAFRQLSTRPDHLHHASSSSNRCFARPGWQPPVPVWRTRIMTSENRARRHRGPPRSRCFSLSTDIRFRDAIDGKRAYFGARLSILQQYRRRHRREPVDRRESALWRPWCPRLRESRILWPQLPHATTRHLDR